MQAEFCPSSFSFQSQPSVLYCPAILNQLKSTLSPPTLTLIIIMLYSKLALVFGLLVVLQLAVAADAMWLGTPCTYSGDYDKDNASCGPDGNNILCVKSGTCDCADKWTTDNSSFKDKVATLQAKTLTAAADKNSCA